MFALIQFLCHLSKVLCRKLYPSSLCGASSCLIVLKHSSKPISTSKLEPWLRLFQERLTPLFVGRWVVFHENINLLLIDCRERKQAASSLSGVHGAFTSSPTHAGMSEFHRPPVPKVSQSGIGRVRCDGLKENIVSSGTADANTTVRSDGGLPRSRKVLPPGLTLTVPPEIARTHPMGLKSTRERLPRFRASKSSFHSWMGWFGEYAERLDLSLCLVLTCHSTCRKTTFHSRTPSGEGSVTEMYRRREDFSLGNWGCLFGSKMPADSDESWSHS